MASIVEVELRNMTVLPEDYDASRYSPQVAFEFVYKNKGSKDIRAFTGVTTFADIFGRPRKQLGLTVDEPLGAGKEVIDHDKVFEPNKFIDDEAWLLTTEAKNVKFSFVPKSIIFSDGSQIGKAEQ